MKKAIVWTNFKLLILFSIFYIGNTGAYTPPPKIKVLEVKNETDWPLLLKIYTLSSRMENAVSDSPPVIYKHRVSKNKVSRWYNHNISKIEVEPYGVYRNLLGTTKCVYDYNKDQVDKICGLIIKVIPGSLKWKIQRELINSDFDLPKPLTSIKELNQIYLDGLMEACWKELNNKPAYVKEVLDKLSSNDLRYILGITKDTDYNSLNRAPEEKILLLSEGLSKELKNIVCINFYRSIFKYAYIKLILENFSSYKKQINEKELKRLISTDTTLNIMRTSSNYNRTQDKKDLVNIMLSNTLNEIANIVTSKS